MAKAVRLTAALFALMLLAGAAQAHWPDVKFRNLTAEPLGDYRYRFSVLMVNTEGTTNSNNVSFELENGTAEWEACPQFVSLRAFVKETLECETALPGPGEYNITFQAVRTRFAAEAAPAVSTPPPATPTPAGTLPTPVQPGFAATAALAALLVGGTVAWRGRRE